MKTEFLWVGMSNAALIGCLPTTAVIAGISESKVVIASNSVSDGEKGTIVKETQ